MVALADLYDADQRLTDPDVRRLSWTAPVPHPIVGARYADGLYDPHFETPDGVRDEDHRCSPSCRLGVLRRRHARTNRPGEVL